ncbi:MAG: DUF434 domain-containing protein [Saprospiraceae bacterium]|nr:DUF434 domain-containing protein [Saprospiraceae bacterium]
MANAARDLYYLLSRNYGERAAIKTVGDRYRLVQRQRCALRRIVSPQNEIKVIRSREVAREILGPEILLIDGFNLLILAEVALSGGFIFECLDGTFRDIASIHGSYRRIAETPDAILLIGEQIRQIPVKQTQWFLDQPVSNSGRLRQLIQEIAIHHGWPWSVELYHDADQALIHRTSGVIATSDRHVLARCSRWVNLAYSIISASGNPNLITLDDLGLNALS